MQRKITLVVTVFITFILMSGCSFMFEDNASGVDYNYYKQLDYDGIVLRILDYDTYHQLGEWTPEIEGDVFLVIDWEVENGSDDTIKLEDLPYMWLEDDEFYYETDLDLVDEYSILKDINLEDFYRDMEPSATELNCDVFIIDGDLMDTDELFLAFSTTENVIYLD